MLTVHLRKRVEWSHCDPAKIIFNPNYYIWMDEASHALLKQAGCDLVEQINDPESRGFPLVNSSADFISPAYYGDTLVLQSSVARFGNKSFTVAHTFMRGDQTLAKGTEVRVCGAIDLQQPEKLKAIAVPDWLKQNLSEERVVDVSV